MSDKSDTNQTNEKLLVKIKRWFWPSGNSDANLIVGEFLTSLKWDAQNAEASLDKLYKFAYEEAKKAEDWYWWKTSQKKRWAMALRVVSILSVTLAGIIPILGPIVMDSSGDPLINPIWSSVAVAFGTAALGLDKFFGYSSGWIRYVTSALSVKGWLIEFKYDWELNRAMTIANDSEYSEQELQSMITKCAAFALKISNAVQEETRQWAQEFQTSLGTLGEALQQRASINQPSGVIITLENGDKCEDGWDVLMNGRKLGKHYGKTGVLHGLYPGLYQILINGKVNKKELHSETALKVEAGQITNISLTLT